MLEWFVLLRCYVEVGRVASGHGGDVVSPLDMAFECLS